jgi:glutamate/tyrosine decarboxylase-like PLP-dependent enzyme
MPRPTPQQAIEAIHASRGLLTLAAALLKCSRTTLQKLVNRHQAVAEAVEQEREAMGDLAEARLYTAIKEGNLTACIFYLKCLHKHRGYVEKPEPKTPPHTEINLIAVVTEARRRALDRRQAQACSEGTVIDLKAEDPQARM